MVFRTPVPEYVEADECHCYVAYGRRGFGYAYHEHAPAAWHDLRYVIRVETIFSTHAKPHHKQSCGQPYDRGREHRYRSADENHRWRETQVSQISTLIAPASDEYRSHHNTYKAH